MNKKISLTSNDQLLIRRYLIWFYKSVKEGLDRIDRKFTQVTVDDFILGELKKAKIDQSTKVVYDTYVHNFEDYVQTKHNDGLKSKFKDSSVKSLHPDYVYLANRLKAVESAIVHFLGAKDLSMIRRLYEEEMTRRILEAREER